MSVNKIERLLIYLNSNLNLMESIDPR